MTTATASGQVEERRWWGKVMSRLSKVFELNPQGLHWGRGVMFLDIALVPFAFGLDLQHGEWLPIATLIAMKPDLDSSRLVAEQRLAGALIGAAVAALLLVVAADEHGLKLFTYEHALFVVALVLFMHGPAIRMRNYALYCGAIAAGALIAMDLPNPSNLSALGDRVLYTLGVGIAVLVMLGADLLGKRRTKAQTQPA